MDERFWNGKYDTEHVGEFEIKPMNSEEKAEMFERFSNLPSLLAGKKALFVKT